jgi:hypothetical protein
VARRHGDFAIVAVAALAERGQHLARSPAWRIARPFAGSRS